MSGAAVEVPARLAVMAVDPGVTTGLAWGMFVSGDSLASTLESGGLESREVSGPYWSQAFELCDAWQEFYFDSQLAYVPIGGIALVVEDFVLRTRTKARDALAPVRVAAAFATALAARAPGLGGAGAVELQQPSVAMSLATSARLRAWGLWKVGSDHERDARRHAVTRVARWLE